MNNINVEQLLQKLASQVSEEVFTQCVEESQETFTREKTAIEKRDEILSNEEYIQKVASDQTKAEAFRKIAREAEKEELILRIGDVTSDMLLIKQAALNQHLAEAAAQEEIQNKEASQKDLVSQLLDLS